jgi:hypothetical protein
MRSETPDGGADTLAIAVTFLVVATVAALLLRDSMSDYVGMSMRGDPGPFFLPQLCIAIIGIAGLVLLPRALWLRARRGARFTPTHRLVETARAWALSAGMTLSLLAMPSAMAWLGTSAAVAIFAIAWIFVLLWAAHGLRGRNAVEALAYGGMTALAVEAIFIRLLHLPLPG